MLLVLASQPYGQLLLAMLAVGLLGYVLRRFIQAAIDPGHRRMNPRRLVQRLGYVMSGCSYLGISYSGLLLMLGWGELPMPCIC